MYELLLGFLTAFLITFFAIPSVINVAKVKHLFDEPGERTSHTTRVPTLGGFAIFGGLIFAITFWTPFAKLGSLQFILCAMIITFLVGAKDDIVPLTPAKKFAGQLLAAMILVLRADIRITSLYGVFGFYDLPYWVSIAISIVAIVGIINAINLIDGINGLSGSVGSIICVTFGTWFYLSGRMEYAIIAASLIGSLIAFLHYNITPAKIFMGDTGSLLVGLVCSILAIEFIEGNKLYEGPYSILSVPAVAFGVMIIPLFDTLRVFALRIMRGHSPFRPDRTHIHHLLLDLGLSHMQATATLIAANLGFIALVFVLQAIGTLNLLMVVFAMALLLTEVLFLAVLRKRRHLEALAATKKPEEQPRPRPATRALYKQTGS